MKKRLKKIVSAIKKVGTLNLVLMFVGAFFIWFNWQMILLYRQCDSIHAREPRNLATQSRLLQQSTKKRGNSLSFCHKVLCCIKIFCIFSKLLHHMKSASLKFISIKS